jgi:hypothetical protein
MLETVRFTSLAVTLGAFTAPPTNIGRSSVLTNGKYHLAPTNDTLDSIVATTYLSTVSHEAFTPTCDIDPRMLVLASNDPPKLASPSSDPLSLVSPNDEPRLSA